jgi:hypothetical protein
VPEEEDVEAEAGAAEATLLLNGVEAVTLETAALTMLLKMKRAPEDEYPTPSRGVKKIHIWRRSVAKAANPPQPLLKQKTPNPIPISLRSPTMENTNIALAHRLAQKDSNMSPITKINMSGRVLLPLTR